MREYTILKTLSAKYPLEFLNQLKFSKKLPSLAVLFADWMDRDLQTRYRVYQYVPPPQAEILLGEKVGDDLKINKKQNLRSWL